MHINVFKLCQATLLLQEAAVSAGTDAAEDEVKPDTAVVDAPTTNGQAPVK